MPIPDHKTPDQDAQGIEIRSPNRPLTREAKKDLKNFTEINAELSPPEGYNHRMDGVIVADLPPKDLLEKHELSVVSDPDIVYKSNKEERIFIYTDLNTVIMDGIERDDDPERIIEMSEDADHINLEKGNPSTVTDN